MNIYIEETKAGYIGFSWTTMGVTAVTLPCTAIALALAELEMYTGLKCCRADLTKPLTDESAYGLGDMLKNYFCGLLVDFKSFSVDLTTYTPFQALVLIAVREIPYGRVMSYGQVAKAIDKPSAFRAVGGALNRNRLLYLIPCHRVIKSNGTLGGFGEGIHWKQSLLGLEGFRDRATRY